MTYFVFTLEEGLGYIEAGSFGDSAEEASRLANFLNNLYSEHTEYKVIKGEITQKSFYDSMDDDDWEDDEADFWDYEDDDEDYCDCEECNPHYDDYEDYPF